MKEYSLKDVRNVYSSFGDSPIMNNIANYLNFFGKGNSLRKKAVNKLNLKSEDKVLDLACGMGYNFDYLINKIGNNGRIVAVDYIQEMLNAAKKRNNESGWDNISLIRNDAAKLNFPKNYFIV